MTGAKYKPIASVDQSDLEFLIPADNDTYIDPNEKIYVRSKLSKAGGTALDNTDFRPWPITFCIRSSFSVESP